MDFLPCVLNDLKIIYEVAQVLFVGVFKEVMFEVASWQHAQLKVT